MCTDSPSGVKLLSRSGWPAGIFDAFATLVMFASYPARAVNCPMDPSIVDQAICPDTGITADEHPCKPYRVAADAPHGCLEKSYGMRLATVRQLRPSVAICRALLDRYRPLANSHPGEDPLAVLAESRKAAFRRFTRGKYIGLMGSLADDLVTWSKKQQPPVAISPQVPESVDGESALLEKAPGVPFFTLVTSDGRCDTSVFFVVRDAVAVPVPKPFRDEDCAESGNFASLDSTPLYVRDNYDYWHEMTTSVEVAVWHVDHFRRACSISLSYSPQMIAESANPSGKTCSEVSCEDMRKAALALAEDKNDGSLSEATLLNRLDGNQRKIYEAGKISMQSSAESSDNAVLVPYVFQERVFIVRIADQISRGINTPDQLVAFEQVKPEGIVQDEAFTVETPKGMLQEATVLPMR